MKPTRWWTEQLRPERIRLRVRRQTYERGETYQCDGRVLSLRQTDDALTATVQGSILYEVKFWRRGRDLQFACTCPFAQEGAFCKHAVAVALEAHFRSGKNDLPTTT